MKHWTSGTIITTIIAIIGVTNTETVQGQIIPDASLPVNSIVTQDGNNVQITGGTTAGGNLFHSFQEFSLLRGGEAYFNNAAAIENIFARITGSSISRIDGLIQSNGGANLYLLNPNGIIFGANARLNIGGSFFATTADRVVFNDGQMFSVENPNSAPPLLTINVPVGLQFGSNGGIEVIGGGVNSFTDAASPSFGDLAAREIESQQMALASDVGLRVLEGKTIGLFGGSLNLDGAVLAAPLGRIQLRAITSGEISLGDDNFGGIDTVYNDVKISGNSALITSGIGGGRIEISGRRLGISDRSQVRADTFGTLPGGKVTLFASEAVEINTASTIGVQTFGAATAGEVMIETSNLTITGGSWVHANSLAAGTAGNITIRASSGVELRDAPNRGFTALAEVLDASSLVGPGSGGTVRVETRQFVARDGARVGVQTLGAGNAGTITLRASESVEVSGVSPDGELVSHISAATLGTGDAGSVILETQRLALRDGAAIGSLTRPDSDGEGGIVRIVASDAVEIVGTTPDGRFGSTLSAVTAGRGDAGSIVVETGRLTVRDRALVEARTTGTGNAGNITINSSNVRVQNQGNITVSGSNIGIPGNININTLFLQLQDNSTLSAESATGKGGNITLQAADIRIREQSSITAAGSQTGNITTEGNISIDAETLVLLENSNITTSAIDPQGGSNITITALPGKDLVLLKSPDSTINAVGELTIEGYNQVQTPDIPTPDITQIDNLISNQCRDTDGSSFFITGRGGIPPSPVQPLTPTATTITWAVPSEETSHNLPPKHQPPTIEANGWTVAPDGTIVLSHLVICQKSNNQ
ncbi:filamentous hemagglutinin N-terminal domain-containing protein [[Phormidium] sp. ETS-05]|uniref:two-partner secretion domain-containing protein n=1 Tax=[Phormidium] sp. ETS-05 TaxID=222819 RepID=UPI0018EEFEB8|nr:filamentous hemagglutinin N-terminal domain-containing protein [[Phormidium] sp. ETS-05]